MVVTISDYARPVKLIDVGAGGFAIVSPDPFTVRTFREFVFAELPGQVVVQARVIHCAELFSERFLSGWAFLRETPPDRIRRLIASIS